MKWYTLDKKPTKGFGWFAVAQLPKNHSGSNSNDKNIDINGDNSWRKSFGFEKAWLNNGRWFAGSVRTKNSVDITPYITHWAELPDVPILTEPFHSENENVLGIYDKDTKEQVEKLAWKLWEEDQKTNPSSVNPHAYVYGFVSALKFLGIE